MKRNPITILTGVLLILIFGFMLFSFQVRQTELAVVTTFGRYSRTVDQPGFQFRMPWPIQKIYKFDNRIQQFDGKLDQTITRDQINVLILVYTGWRIADARMFLESFSGDVTKAEQKLEPLVRNAKNNVIGQHAFSEMISTNLADVKFDQVEKEMLDTVRPQARSAYGIQIEFLGIKQLQLPESITTTVFERMKAERQRLVTQYQSDGDREARIIKSEADRQASAILAAARAQAIMIVGNADKEAAAFYATFAKHPELAVFLFQLKAIEDSLKTKAQLILDQRTPPFNLLNGTPGGSSAATPSSGTSR
jgi:membrane protease subunit HflC